MLLAAILLYLSLKTQGGRSEALERIGTRIGLISLVGLSVCWVLFGACGAMVAETRAPYWIHLLDWTQTTALALLII